MAVKTKVKSVVKLSGKGQRMSLIGTTIPTGTVLAYAGTQAEFKKANCDNDWAICDGTNGTPDLRGYFIEGANSWSNAGQANGPAGFGYTTPVNNPSNESQVFVDVPFSPPNNQTGTGRGHKHVIPAVILMYIMKT
jgi:hypothetical protein